MDQETLWRQFSALPREARMEVADFIAFLRAKYVQPTRNAHTSGDLHDEPFIGIWRDRADMTEAHEWVRRVRQQEWHEQ